MISSLHSGCYILPASSSVPRPEWKDMLGSSYLELKIPRSFTHYMPSSCESRYSFSSTEGRCLSDGERREALIYKPHEMSLKVVLFLPSFSRTVQFDFLPVPGFIGPQVLGYLSRTEIKFQLIEWASNSIVYWLATPTNLYHYCTSTEKSSLKTKGCVAVYLML